MASPRPQNPRPLGAAAIVFVGVASALAMLYVQAVSRTEVTHDEAISFLAATGNQGRYAADIPSSQWVEAAEWQSYWKVGRFGQFRLIRDDLANHDIHPPLYFWLLHIWVHIWGTGVCATAGLNALILLAAAALVFLLCIEQGCSRLAAAAASSAWTLSGATLAAAVEARQYLLFALVVVAFTTALVIHCRRGNRFTPVAVFLAALAGLLVHYQFAFVLGAGVCMGFIAMWRARRWRTLAELGIAVAIACAAAIAANPRFSDAIARAGLQAQPFAVGELLPRALRGLQAVLGIILPYSLLAHRAVLWMVTAVCLGGVVAALLPKARQRVGAVPGREQGAKWVPGAIVACVILATLVTYVVCISPRHAMSPKYLVAAGPLVFVVFGQFIGATLERTRAAWRQWLVVLLLPVIQLLHGTVETARSVARARETVSSSVPLDGTPLVLDSVYRGVLARTLWNVIPATPVYAAEQERLLEDSAWMENLPTRFLFVSDLWYSNTYARRQEILARLRERGFGITDLKQRVRGNGDCYLVIAQQRQG